MSHDLAAVTLALVAALFIAIGIVARQHSTRGVPQEQGVSGTMATTLLREPLWWAGTASAVGGYAFQAWALSKGSLLIVQPVLVSSLLFALPLSARVAHRRVTPAEWRWALLLTAAIAVFVVVGDPRPGHQVHATQAWTVVTVLAVAVVTGCVVLSARRPGRPRAVLLAVAVAVLFAVVAVLTKVAVHTLDSEGLGPLLTSPAPYALAVVGLLATVLQQSAFHAGALQVSVPTMIVLEPMVAVGIGFGVLGEHLAVSGPAVVGLAATVVVMVLATAALASQAAGHSGQVPARAHPVPA